MDFASVANSADRVAFNFAFDSRIDGRLNIARGPVDVPVQIKLQCDASSVQLTDRSDFIHAGDVSEPSLQRLQDLRPESSHSR